MKTHWRDDHQWSTPPTAPGQKRGSAGQDALEQHTRRVTCQRFFPRQTGSAFFHVRVPPPGEEPAQIAPATLLDEILDQADTTFQDLFCQDQQVVEEIEVHM